MGVIGAKGKGNLHVHIIGTFNLHDKVTVYLDNVRMAYLLENGQLIARIKHSGIVAGNAEVHPFAGHFGILAIIMGNEDGTEATLV